MNPAAQEALVQLSEERKVLSTIFQLIKGGIDSNLSKRAETTLAFRGAQIAFMWLGKAKGVLGGTNPYPESSNPDNKVIEPTDDFLSIPPFEESMIAEDEVVFLKHIRKQLEKSVRDIHNDLLIFPDNRDYQLCIERAWVGANEAKMWLGWALAEVRNEKPKKSKRSSELKDLSLSGQPTSESPSMSTSSDDLTLGSSEELKGQTVEPEPVDEKELEGKNPGLINRILGRGKDKDKPKKA
jgi:hypothetical protein